MPRDELLISRRHALQSIGGVIAAGMLGGGLAACGDSSSDSSATKVEAWIYRPEYRKSIDKILAAFEKAHPEIAVEMGYKPTGQYPTILKTALVGGAGPDAIATNGASGIWGDVGADGGYIIPLDGKLDLETLTPAVREAIQYKGHVYGSPVQTFRIGVYYQKAVFAEHGLEEPKSWDDLTALCKTLNDADVVAWSMPAQDMIIPFFLYHLAVNSILGETSAKDLSSGKRKLTDPDLLPAAQLLVDLQPYYNEGFQAVAYAEGKALFAQSRAAMTVGGSSDYVGYTEVNPDLDVGFFGFPSPDGVLAPVVLDGLSMAYTVNKKSKVTEAATTFVTWLATEEAQRIVLADLGLPSIQGIEPEGDDPRSAVLRTILSIDGTPSWLDYQATGGISPALQEGGGAGIFTGKLSPEQFAATAQKSIVTTADSGS